jgi:hypothetical protein
MAILVFVQFHLQKGGVGNWVKLECCEV